MAKIIYDLANTGILGLYKLCTAKKKISLQLEVEKEAH